MAEQEPPKAEAVETKARKLVTPEQFITRWPLYTPAPVEGFSPPARISYPCSTPLICEKETTWLRVGIATYVRLEDAGTGYNWVWYLCGLCSKKYLVVWYRDVEYEQRPVRRRVSSGLTRNTPVPGSPSTVPVLTKVQKVGQYPPQSIGIPKGLEKELGEEGRSLYKKGLINRNEGFGLGALTYIRRVVEDKTNELIEVAAKLAESHDVEAKIVEQIRKAAIERATYDQKLKIAATVLPKSLLIEGINPLLTLYGLVSEGVHGLTEAECIAVADETTSVFEYIFANLRAQTTARQDFVQKVQKWAGRAGAKREDETKPTSSGSPDDTR